MKMGRFELQHTACISVWFFFLLLLLWSATVPRCEGYVVSSSSSSTKTIPTSSYEIKSGTWTFRNQHPIAFEVAKRKQTQQEEDSVTDLPYQAPLLLLNGFGVGSFHQHKLIDALLASKNDDNNNAVHHEGRSIYCIDYLGQGRSWPVDCQDGFGPSELGLRYCGDTWLEQIEYFIQDCILPKERETSKEKVHIVGNSVGGHLAVCLAAKRPDLVESLCLLNATPVWGLNLPGWSGVLPPPPIAHKIGTYLFDQIRNPNTINVYLKTAYANGDAAFDQDLVQRIRECTMGTGGHAAFASIMWSPPISVDLPKSSTTTTTATTTKAQFEDCLRALECNVLLCFGAEDSWCKPAFAKRMLQTMQQSSSQSQTTAEQQRRYVELSRVGHCPNHEAPRAVAHVVTNWLQAPHLPLVKHNNKNDMREEESPQSSSQEQQRLAIEEEWGVTHVQELKEHEIELSWLDQLATQFV